ANVELEVEVEAALAEHAEGIGLYRTEFLYLDGAPPDEDRLVEVFSRVARAIAPRVTTLRTFDLGADKLPLAHGPRIAGGALGLRGLRLALARPELFEAALRAMLRAAADAPIRVMFPMVTTLGELKLATQALESARRSLRRRRVPHGKVEVGAMIEVPSLLFELDSFIPRLDFLSVGSNDLLQYLYAADRNNTRVASRYDPLAVAPLRALLAIVEAARRHGKPLSLCGEMAGRPLEALALLGLGFRTISMAPASIGPVKAMILSLDVAALETWLAEKVRAGEGNLRAELKRWAESNDVDI
ncbi:MAG: putative PEP-binding protein, partial [Hyphomicrobiaceae bacterium]|nr:putative PEP-binding protein [Hyphomicrobiaceae bacterium]